MRNVELAMGNDLSPPVWRILFLYGYIRRHSRLQQSFAVIDADFDAEDQMVAFVAALHVARGEFALSVDLLDHAVERAVGEGVDFDFGLLADLDQAELRFGDVDADVDLIFFEQPRDGLVRRDEIAGADRQDFDDGPGGRFDFALGDLDFDLFEPAFRLGQLGACVGYLLGARMSSLRLPLSSRSRRFFSASRLARALSDRNFAASNS